MDKSQDHTASIGTLKQICEDLRWECEIVLEMVTLALVEKRFWILAPKKEEWAELRIKSDALDIISSMLRERTGRYWSHEEVVEFKNKLELEFFHPARQEISFETQIQLLFNKEQECALCGTKGIDMIPEIDHRKPIRRGGSSQYSNLQWLCRSCNRKKLAKIGKEWKNA